MEGPKNMEQQKLLHGQLLPLQRQPQLLQPQLPLHGQPQLQLHGQLHGQQQHLWSGHQSGRLLLNRIDWRGGEGGECRKKKIIEITKYSDVI